MPEHHQTYMCNALNFLFFFIQSAIGIELWSMSKDILFDNLLITDDIIVAQEWASVTYDLKRKQLDLESVSNALIARM